MTFRFYSLMIQPLFINVVFYKAGQNQTRKVRLTLALGLILVSIAIQWRILSQKNTQTDYKC
jgi:hypothetical protein